MQTLTPRVYWAQRHEEIYLRVELTDAQIKDISIQDNVLQFKAQGHGAQGENEYEFSLDFLLPVDPEPVQRSTQRQVNVVLRKPQRGWWARLTRPERRPAFLAPDFDRWMDESDAETEILEKERNKKRLRMDSVDSEDSEVSFLSLKKVLLFMYNLVQFLGFSWMFLTMTTRLFTLGRASLYNTFHAVSAAMLFCQMLAAVEVLNAAFGVVKAAVVPVLIQVVGRNFFLLIILGSVEQLQSKPVVFFVFYTWSAMEIFRYPFYMLGCVGVEWKLLTWLRYTVWIPLYPLGVLAEAMAVVQAMPLFSETASARSAQLSLLSARVPAALGPLLGSTLSFSWFLHLYLVLMVLGLFVNFRHLSKLRRRRFPARKRKTH